MPHNRPQQIKSQQNKTSTKEESITLRQAKAAKYPPSLNEIPKQES